jgi:cytochrome c oxidase subunit II
MEENKTETDNPVTQSDQGQKMNPMLIVGLIVVVVVFGIGILLVKSGGNSNSQTQEDVVQNVSLTPSTNTSTVNPTTVADETNVKVITVEGGMYYFKPNEIKVKKGEKVKITFTNVEGLHDFVVDEFNVRTEKIQSNQTVSVEFTPDKVGVFEFYCSVGNHRAMGMKGNLIVE